MSWLALALSSGTLICCTLPILLVMLGFGAAFAALTSSLPILVTLAAHKGWIFALSAVALAAAGVTTYRAGRTCPTDPITADACRRANGAARRVLAISLVVWCVGFATAYLALPIRVWLES